MTTNDISNNEINDEVIWTTITSYLEYFQKHGFVQDGYNDFFQYDLPDLFQSHNPIVLKSGFDTSIQDYRYQCHL